MAEPLLAGKVPNSLRKTYVGDSFVTVGDFQDAGVTELEASCVLHQWRPKGVVQQSPQH